MLGKKACKIKTKTAFFPFFVGRLDKKGHLSTLIQSWGCKLQFIEGKLSSTFLCLQNESWFTKDQPYIKLQKTAFLGNLGWHQSKGPKLAKQSKASKIQSETNRCRFQILAGPKIVLIPYPNVPSPILGPYLLFRTCIDVIDICSDPFEHGK